MVAMLLLGVACLQLAVIPLTSASHVSATAVFNSSGVMGTIRFEQEMIGAATTITASLTGLFNIAGSSSFQWHVHQYPFHNDGNPMPCGGPIVGGHYDPAGVGTAPDYLARCAESQANCEIGDLSGKFGNFQSASTISETYTDPRLDLYGVYSIIGRSIVIHFENASRFVCANIREDMNSDSMPTNLLYSPYRNDFVGNIYFRQHMRNISSAWVYSDLFRIVGNQNSVGHNWHVHESPLDLDGTDCGIAGPHYNPRNVDVSEGSGYNTSCGSANATVQRNCEIGDQSNKGAPFDIAGGVVKQFYTDTDLPLFRNSEGYYINDRSTVIHAENRTGPRIACANVTVYQPLEALARFNENGVSGTIRFYQHSPFDPTIVFVDLKGLRSMADVYDLHAYSVGPGSSPGRCADRYIGDHWNPLDIPEGAAGMTSDQFEIGDLSGKFGGLAGQNNFYGKYSDPNIPLFGQYSIIGRSAAIYFDNEEGTRWLCSNIERIARTVQIQVSINNADLTGTVTFSQAADDPYSETTIVVELNVNRNLPYTANGDGLVQFDWSVRQGSPTSESDCSGTSVLNVYDSNAGVCSPTQQLACVVGDLSDKHGSLMIPQASGNTYRAVFTDNNLPLSGRPGLESVFFGDSRSGYLSLQPNGGTPQQGVCVRGNAAAIVAEPATDAPPTDGATPIARVSSALISVCLVLVAVLAINWY